MRTPTVIKSMKQIKKLEELHLSYSVHDIDVLQQFLEIFPKLCCEPRHLTLTTKPSVHPVCMYPWRRDSVHLFVANFSNIRTLRIEGTVHMHTNERIFKRLESLDLSSAILDDSDIFWNGCIKRHASSLHTLLLPFGDNLNIPSELPMLKVFLAYHNTVHHWSRGNFPRLTTFIVATFLRFGFYGHYARSAGAAARLKNVNVLQLQMFDRATAKEVDSALRKSKKKSCIIIFPVVNKEVYHGFCMHWNFRTERLHPDNVPFVYSYYASYYANRKVKWMKIKWCSELPKIK